MTKLESVIVSVILIVACLFTLSACQVTITPMIEAPEQSTEDGKVSINLAIDKVGWLVLHPATAEGEPDTSVVLSKTYLTAAGEWTDSSSVEVTIPLTIEERIIFARLYYDDPIDGKFEPSSDNSSDPTVTTVDGIVQDSFTVPSKPPYIEIEQSTTTRKVSFSVGIDAPGWLILHPETPEGEPDTSTVLVKAQFPEAGETDFSVTLPGTIEAGTVIYAALYYDNPLDGEFSYTPDGDEDLPVQANGSDVIESFVVGG